MGNLEIPYAGYLPGVGWLTALTVVTEVGEIERFPTSKHLCSYAGLVPRVRASGGRVQHGRITKEGPRMLRWILAEAASLCRCRSKAMPIISKELYNSRGIGMHPEPDSPEHHRQRSEFIRKLVQSQFDQQLINDRYMQGTPKTIMQFWHDLRQLPEDVKDCIASWARWETKGYRHRLFDERSAKEFIGRALGARHEHAFERCYHPAMQADYFRLCYLLVEGGLYVDADDVCVCADIGCLFEDGRLKAQPLCYDISTGKMVDPSIFLGVDAYASSWIFYFNNNPLIANRGHPIIEIALNRATDLLELAGKDELLEIQETTGPGNLSKSIFEFGSALGGVESDLMILRDWDSFAVSKWALSYRNDARNWRLSNQQKFYRNGE